MNPGWDQDLALRRMDTLGIPLRRKVKARSGGQQAQVALTLALAKRAPLLALDEPVASLDPIARLDFMRDVLAASADSGLTVLIASHVISELERFCDWLLVLTGYFPHEAVDERAQHAVAGSHRGDDTRALGDLNGFAEFACHRRRLCGLEQDLKLQRLITGCRCALSQPGKCVPQAAGVHVDQAAQVKKPGTWLAG